MPKESVVFTEVKGEIEQIMYKACQKCFGQQREYSPTSVATWISQCNQDIVTNSLNLNGNFKYLINTQVMQKKPGGTEGPLAIEGSTFWNSGTDGQSIIQYEHPQFYVFVTVFGIAL